MTEIKAIQFTNAALVLVWGFAALPVLLWVFDTLTHTDHRMNGMLLILVGAVMVRQLRNSRPSHLLMMTPSWRMTPALVAAIGMFLYIYGENYLDIDLFSASGFALGSLGILGFYLDQRSWLRLFPSTILLIAVLPFQFHLEAYVGFPLRVFIASTAEYLLGLEPHTTATILALENELAAIDLPCSGLKSLWVGVLFILMTSLLQNLMFGWRWLLFILMGLSVLVALNVARVLILTELIVNFGRQPWIDMIHVPLGMVAFAVGCMTFYVSARRLVPENSTVDVRPFDNPRCSQNHIRRTFAVIFTAVIASIFLHSPMQQLHSKPTDFVLPSLQTLVEAELPLTAGERDLFSRFDAAQVAKYRFVEPHLSGSLLISRSTHWRTHHNPEQCFRGMGIDFSHSETLLIENRPLRAILNDEGRIIGMYWFQSIDQLTDDFSERIFASLWGGKDDWVLVSYLFDRPLPRGHRAIADRVITTRQTMAAWMNDNMRSAI